MNSISKTMSTRELRGDLADTVSEVQFGRARVGITRNGKLAAILIDPDDLAVLEAAEMHADIAAYDRAKAESDGTSISFEDFAAGVDA